MNDRPWMTALEMQFASLKFVSEAKSKQSLQRFHKFYRLSEQILRQAETFAWTKETVTAIGFASKTVPLNAELGESLMSFHSGWWWLDDYSPIFTSNLQEERAQIHALLLGTGVADESNERGLFVIQFMYPADDAAALAPLCRFFWPFNASADSVIKRQTQNILESDLSAALKKIQIEALHYVCRFIVAGLAWLQQRIVLMSHGHVERHRRKQLAREHDAVVSDVKVVQLRRSESESRPPSAGTGDPIEWSCRWIVSGHWRNQYHPSTGRHELKQILPYVKGPEDKPLKVPTHTVYSVSR